MSDGGKIFFGVCTILFVVGCFVARDKREKDCVNAGGVMVQGQYKNEIKCVKDNKVILQ